MGIQLLITLGISLGLTIALELAFAVVATKRDRKNLLLVCLVNVLTNPVVVFAYFLGSHYTTWNLAVLMIPLEIMAVLVEAHTYKTYGRGFSHPLLFSLCANLFSFGTGAILNGLW